MIRTADPEALQVVATKDEKGTLRRVIPGDTNIRQLSRATAYKLRGKSSYSDPGTRGKKK